MPIGIIGSLAVSMSIYFAIALVVVGMVPTSLLGEDIPIVNALLANACCSHSDQFLDHAAETCLSYGCEPVLHSMLYVGSRVVSFGAIFGLTTATFTCLMGQPRIFYSMAKDGLLFKIYGQVNPHTGVPTIGTIITGVCTAVVACLIDLESLANTISLGTLMVFTFVNAGVILLRLQPSTSDEVFPIRPHPPPVTDPGAAAVARFLGLDDHTSEQIRESLRSKLTEWRPRRRRTRQWYQTSLAHGDFHDKRIAGIGTNVERLAQLGCDSVCDHFGLLHGFALVFTSVSSSCNICMSHGSNSAALGHCMQFVHDGVHDVRDVVAHLCVASNGALVLLWIRHSPLRVARSP